MRSTNQKFKSQGRGRKRLGKTIIALRALLAAVIVTLLPTPVLAETAPTGDSIAATPAPAPAEKQKSIYIPEVMGVVRARYEYATQENAGRFEVRNARVGIAGKIIPIISYKVMADFCDEGKIKLSDAYIRFSAEKFKGSVTLGQMRVPFSIDAHRGPGDQYFANRSFIAKQAGNVRDVGVALLYGFGTKVPVTLEGGVFNGKGYSGQKTAWGKTYGFTAKATATFLQCMTVEASVQRTEPGDVGMLMWDAGLFYQNERLHIEAEYLRKHYSHGAFRPVNAADAFAAYRFPLRKTLTGISLLARYDYMSDHSDGIKNDVGELYVNDPARQRITAGTTLHFGFRKIGADLRVNYEKYFYHKGVDHGMSNGDKIVVELMCKF